MIKLFRKKNAEDGINKLLFIYSGEFPKLYNLVYLGNSLYKRKVSYYYCSPADSNSPDALAFHEGIQIEVPKDVIYYDDLRAIMVIIEAAFGPQAEWLMTELLLEMSNRE